MLTYLLIFAAVMGGWSFLTVLGNERQRKVQDREQELKNADSEK